MSLDLSRESTDLVLSGIAVVLMDRVVFDRLGWLMVQDKNENEVVLLRVTEGDQVKITGNR